MAPKPPPPYIDPFTHPPFTFAGPDQGVDFSGSGPIRAIGPAVVTRVDPIGGSDWPGPNGQGGAVVVYQFTAGPRKGEYVYTAENFTPSVKVGDTLGPGDVIGTAAGTYPYIETGFATSTGSPIGVRGTSSEGRLFWNFLLGLPGGTGTGGSGSGGGTNTGGGAADGSSCDTPLGPNTGRMVNGKCQLLPGGISSPGDLAKSAAGTFTGIPGDVASAVGGAANAVTGGVFDEIVKAIEFVFSYRFLEIVGGSLLILGGLVVLASKLGVSGPVTTRVVRAVPGA